MKDYMSKLQFGDKEITIAFDLNVLETIQEQFGSLQAWSDRIEPEEGGEPDIKALLFGFTEMINEGIDIDNENNHTQKPFMTKKQVGRLLTQVGLENASKKIMQVVVDSTKSDEKNT